MAYLRRERSTVSNTLTGVTLLGDLTVGVDDTGFDQTMASIGKSIALSIVFG